MHALDNSGTPLLLATRRRRRTCVGAGWSPMHAARGRGLQLLGLFPGKPPPARVPVACGDCAWHIGTRCFERKKPRKRGPCPPAHSPSQKTRRTRTGTEITRRPPASVPALRQGGSTLLLVEPTVVASSHYLRSVPSSEGKKARIWLQILSKRAQSKPELKLKVHLKP
jgi:hypothetical protein